MWAPGCAARAHHSRCLLAGVSGCDVWAGEGTLIIKRVLSKHRRRILIHGQRRMQSAGTLRRNVVLFSIDKSSQIICFPVKCKNEPSYFILADIFTSKSGKKTPKTSFRTPPKHTKESFIWPLITTNLWWSAIFPGPEVSREIPSQRC